MLMEKIDDTKIKIEDDHGEIAISQLRELPPKDILYVDIRDEESFLHGTIPGAINVSPDSIMSLEGTDLASLFPSDITSHRRFFVIFCREGKLSIDPALHLRKMGYDCYSLRGGYTEWLLQSFRDQEALGSKRNDDIEKSIRGKFHDDIFSRFTKAIVHYDLLQPGDHVAVCISGGKDSFLMAKLFQELTLYRKFPFELTFLCMDPGYSPANRQVIENNARLMNIPIQFFETEIFNAVDSVEKNPCYLCARMRRGYLYKEAKRLGCNKIALGHHYDDVIETILMGMLHSGQIQTMMPKLRSRNYEGMELIRPLYLIREDDIKHWRDYNHLNFLQCACHFTDTCTTCHTDGQTGSKRLETKKLIAELKKSNPFVEGNIFKSVENVSLKTIICYKDDDGKHSFLDDY
jgi:tRNA(Ile)-lysidine synthase TilS/MesJ/rhodanese-related sulfurtransferase